jgi:hypothetical protein
MKRLAALFNHQGYGAVTAPGMQVFSTASLNDGRTYAGGAYNLEVKIPLADLPAAIGPTSSLPTANGATNMNGGCARRAGRIPSQSDHHGTGPTRFDPCAGPPTRARGYLRCSPVPFSRRSRRCSPRSAEN